MRTLAAVLCSAAGAFPLSRRGGLDALTLCLSIVMLGSTASWGSQQADQHYELGVTYESTLEIFEALDEFEAAIALDPENTGILEHYAWQLHTYQFREEAVGAFERLLQRETDKKAVYLGLGWNEMDLGRATRSIEFFNAAYDLTAPQDDVGKAYAEIRARSVQDNKAKIAQLQQTLASAPGNVAAEKELFQVYLYQAEWSNAFPLGERLIADSRGDLPLRFAQYRGLLWAGRLTDAEAALSSLMADSPDNAYLHYELGRLLRAMERPKEAEAALVTSLALYPGAMKTRRELSELLARNGKAEEALAIATGMVRESEASLDAQLSLAGAYRSSARWDEALASYRQILTVYPYNVDALSGLAECALHAGDLSAAEEAVETWEIAKPDDPGLKRVREDVANAASSLLVQADSFTNSSDYQRLNAGFAVKLQPWGGINPRLGYYYSQFQQEGFSDIGRHSFQLEGDRRISDSLSVEARLGLNLYDNDQEHVTGRATLRGNPFRGTHLSVSYSHFDIIDTEPAFGNPLYNYVASIGAVGEKITTDDLSLYLQQFIGYDLMLWGTVAHGSYSDGNEKLTYVLGADYRLLEEPRLHLHYSYFFLDYQDPAPTYREGDAQLAAYFDPSNFRVHTPGIEFSFYLTPSLNLYLADDVSYVVSNESVANSIALAVTYEFSKEDSLRLDFRSIADVYRDTDDGDYSAQHFLLSFFHRF